MITIRNCSECNIEYCLYITDNHTKCLPCSNGMPSKYTEKDTIDYFLKINTPDKAYFLGKMFCIDYFNDTLKTFHFQVKDVTKANLIGIYRYAPIIYDNYNVKTSDFTIIIHEDTVKKICSSFSFEKYKTFTGVYHSFFERAVIEHVLISKMLGTTNKIIKNILDKYNLSCGINTDNLQDKLGKIYSERPELSMEFVYKLLERVGEISVVRKSKEAVLPSKPSESDIGYDLTIVEKVKDLTDNTALYTTKLMVKPPKGYYIDIVPRSSLSKSGYMLANSVGIIDPSYRGELMIALTKISDLANEIKFPFRCCQMVLRKAEYSTIQEYSAIDINTVRGEGGFGSSN